MISTSFLDVLWHHGLDAPAGQRHNGQWAGLDGRALGPDDRQGVLVLDGEQVGL